MKKITKYTVAAIFATNWDDAGIINFDKLVAQVNELIEQGWQPLGQVFIDGRYAAQAMVMYDELDDKLSVPEAESGLSL